MSDMDTVTRFANISLEVSVASLCLVVLVGAVAFSQAPVMQRRSLESCLVSCMGLALGDAVSLAAHGIPGDIVRGVVWWGNVVTFESCFALLCSFALYLHARIESPPPPTPIPRSAPRDARASQKRRLHYAVAICMAASLALILSGRLFWVDARSVYHRSALFPLVEMGFVAALAAGLLRVLRNRERLGRRGTVTLTLTIVLTGVACSVQAFVYGLNFGVLACGMGSVIIFAEMQHNASVMLSRHLREIHSLRTDATEARLAAAATQIHPHFMGNTLAVIHHLCLTDPPCAARSVELLSDHMHAVSWALSHDECLPVEHELAHARDYLALCAETSPGRVRWSVEEDACGFMVPPLSVLTLVENAVEHGIGGRREGGWVCVRTRETETAWEVEVTDDGAGFEDACEGPRAAGASAVPPADAHVGIANVRFRVEHMCGGSLCVTSEPEAGTRAVISLPRHANIAGQLPRRTDIVS